MDLKKLDNEDKMLIGAGVIFAAVLGWFWYKNKKEQQNSPQLLPETIPTEPTETQPKNTIPTNATPGINPVVNNDLVLKIGSKGVSVKQLQKLLGFKKPDGVFGKQTEAKLQQLKGVTEISLNNFDSTVKLIPTAPIPVPKKGAKLMARINGVNIYRAKRIANGSLVNTGVKGTFTPFELGEAMGTFVKQMPNKTWLMIYKNGLHFVSPNLVTAY